MPRRSVLLGGGLLTAGATLAVAAASDLHAASHRSTRAADRADGVRPPRIHTTEEWGARPSGRKHTILSRAPRYIVVHHTSTANSADFSLGHGFRLARAIQRAHMGRGWGDTGQHFTISRGGHVMEGRIGSLDATLKGDMVVGTQVRGANDYTVGIECEGTYNAILPPEGLHAALVRMCAWLCSRYHLDPHHAIVPHMKFNETDCCGYRFVPTLPTLQSAVAKLLPGQLEAARG